jgi:2-chlorobenzoate 1,2-dioxygenase
MALTEAELRGMVQGDRVHRRVYSDPAVFDLEMDRLYGTAWIFVAHASQIANPGDFILSRIGRHSVIAARDGDGKVHVLLNRCPHRGAPVCWLDSGNVRFFQCGYHDWSFYADGTVRSVPLNDGYADWENRKAQLGMQQVARIAEYRGFIFGSLAADGPDLLSFLGYMRSSLDDLVDRAPGGEIEVAGGSFRQLSRSNWKLQVENLNDLMHAGATHRSAVQAGEAVTAPLPKMAVGAHRVDGLKANGAPLRKMDELGVHAYPNGHSYIGGLPRPPRTGPVMDSYRAALGDRHGPQRTAEILAVDRHINVIYPSLLTQGGLGYFKVIQPLAVDRTLTCVFPVRLKGAPPEIFHSTIRSVNNSNSVANLILPDDLDMYQRTQNNLAGQDEFWVDLSRGAGTEEPDDHGGLAARGTHELAMRNAYAAWADYLCGAA